MKQRILIVDDCATTTHLLGELLSRQYETVTADSGEQCLALLPQTAPDLVLLDVVMPGVNGHEVCRRIKNSPVGGFTPIILISVNGSEKERVAGYLAGADDYLVKPFSSEELLAKIAVQFRLRRAVEDLWKVNKQVQALNADLERLVDERTSDVLATRDVAVFVLAKMAESRDPETGAHLERMREYCQIIAEELSRGGAYAQLINDQFLYDLYRSTPLHDIGKVATPDAILLKPGRLSAAELSVMQQHTVIGAQALAEAAHQSRCGGFLEMAIHIARHHHERFDGRGYPDGLRGQQIPLAARIVALGDVFDALTSSRIYKAATPAEDARLLILRESGRHFDPAIVQAFTDRFRDILEVHRTHQTPAGPTQVDLHELILC